MIKAISKVKKIELRPSVKIDITEFTGEECFLEFNEPTAAALFPDSELLKTLKIKFPKYPEAMIYQIALLAKCYVIQKDDADSINLYQEFGNLAKDNKDCFYHVLTEFLGAFPTGNLDEKVIEAKND
jgi:hypothetical protein